MKKKLILSKSFEKSFKKFTTKRPDLKSLITKALIKLEEDVFSPALRTHKLSGNLYDYLPCSCGYDCRIIFSIERNITTKLEFILY